MPDKKNTSGTSAGEIKEDIAQYYENLNSDSSLDNSSATDDIGQDSKQSIDTDDNSSGSETYTVISDPDAFGDDPSTFDAPPKISRKNYSILLSSLYVLLVLLIAALALFIVYKIGNSGIKSKELVEQTYVELLENSTEYREAAQDYDSIKETIDDLTKERDEKQAVFDAMQDYESKSTDVNTRLENLRNERNSLNSEIETKKQTLAELESSISSKTSSIVSLSPGIYTVGKNIVAGKYLVTGSGSILISTSSGATKINTVINSDGTQVTLENDDTIKLETRARFTPVN